MWCVIRTDAPQDLKTFTPEWSYLPMYQERRRGTERTKSKTMIAITGLELPNDTPVWVSTPQGQIPGKITSSAPEPRSYHVEVPSGQVRRNRSHLRIRATPSELEAATTDDRDCRIIYTYSLQTGTQIRPPARYTEWHIRHKPTFNFWKASSHSCDHCHFV